MRQAHAHMRRYLSALPDRWVSMPLTELQRLLGLYRERRETWGDSHTDAVGNVLVEAVVYEEPSRADLEDQYNADEHNDER